MKLATYITACLLALLASACGRTDGGESRRSVYYWSTVLDIDSTKQAFIDRHGISRMYVRYFDVVAGEDGSPVPNATLRFSTGVPQGMEIVPTVYIVNDCMAADTTDLARLTLRRIMQMNATNDVGKVKEIQIDCDWTRRTRQRYFSFLRTLRAMAAERGVKVSATIRLHQLAESAPPVKRGVLMMYNTGDFTDISCGKPILDMRDAAPYLRHLADYELPLSAAYPIYSWRILFRGGRYVGIMHRDDDLPVLPGDSIVTRAPSLDDITTAAGAVGSRRPDANSEIILFDLSKQNATRFKPDDYEKIFGYSDI
mgnify:CR=1 FL=1